jgi:hypothetical protein
MRSGLMFWLDPRRPTDASNPATQPLLPTSGQQQQAAAAMPRRDARRAARALRAAWAAAHVQQQQQQQLEGDDPEASPMAPVPGDMAGPERSLSGGSATMHHYEAPALGQVLASLPSASASAGGQVSAGLEEGPTQAIQVPAVASGMVALPEGAHISAAPMAQEGVDERVEIHEVDDGEELLVPPTPPVARSSWAWLSGRGRRG